MADTNVVQKDLGPVSAYAIAVKHGYKGTEEEWAALQIASAENAKAADASAKEAAETLAAVHETVEQETTDAVAAVNNQETASIQALQAAAQAAAAYQEERIAVKGEQTLASIPDDYTKLGQDVAALTEEMGELKETLVNVCMLEYSQATIIPNGTDFNDLTTPGNYRVNSMNQMATMLNSPSAQAGRLTVMSLQSVNAIVQEYTINVSDQKRPIRYTRSHTASAGWGDWHTAVTSQDLDFFAEENDVWEEE